MFRYFGFTWNASSPDQRATTALIENSLRKKNPGWQEVHALDGLRFFCLRSKISSHRHYLLPDGAGVVLGTVFRRYNQSNSDSYSAPATFSREDASKILRTQGRSLMEDYWGNYIAVIHDLARHSVKILKDPTGPLPCFHVEHDQVHFFFSHVLDSSEIHEHMFHVNWSWLSNYIATGWMSAHDRPLQELDEITRSECLEIDTSSNCVRSRTSYWHPGQFLSAAIEDEAYGVRLVRDTVRHCVQTWANQHPNRIIRVSGGLDSSIVLSCLKHQVSAPQQLTTGVTYFGNDRSSDERQWARIASQDAGITLNESLLDASSICLASLLDIQPTPSPLWPTANYLMGNTERRLAKEAGATAIFSGDGGDAGFGSTSISVAMDEYLQRHGLNPNAIRLARQIASYRDSSATQVLLAAVRRRYRGTRFQDHTIMFQKLTAMTTPEVREAARHITRFPHPWLQDLDGVPWGTILRLGTLLYRSEFYDPFCPPEETPAEWIQPLYSQPVVEALLSLTLYTLFANGRNRGLARNAFTGEVPTPLLQRQWKGRGSTLNGEIVYGNRRFLREFLLDGQLVRQHLLSKPKIEKALSDVPCRDAFDSSILLQYMNVELWAYKWMSAA